MFFVVCGDQLLRSGVTRGESRMRVRSGVMANELSDFHWMILACAVPDQRVKRDGQYCRYGRRVLVVVAD